MKLWNVAKIKAAKSVAKLACVTAYDAAFARLADQSGIPLILVGDSLGMTMLGFDSTLPVTMEDMLHHTAAVARSAKNALVVGDMPFLSYQISVQDGLRNAGRFLQEAGADAVKIEGGAFRAPLVEALTSNGIPVVGHIGLTPQSVNLLGGYKVQGKTREASETLIADAKALVEAGVFSIVIECVPPDIGAALTQAVSVPTIGVGAGPDCDGQMIVMHDLLGLSDNPPPKFVKPYANLAQSVRDAFGAYAADVKSGAFPDATHSYAHSEFSPPNG